MPKKNNAIVVVTIVEHMVTIARDNMPIKLANKTTRLQPKLSTSLPAIAMDKQEPTPSNKIMEPNTSSPMLSFAFKYGTNPAHKAVYIPGIKNAPKAPRILDFETETCSLIMSFLVSRTVRRRKALLYPLDRDNMRF